MMLMPLPRPVGGAWGVKAGNGAWGAGAAGWINRRSRGASVDRLAVCAAQLDAASIGTLCIDRSDQHALGRSRLPHGS
jgi:hypothetical protein